MKLRTIKNGPTVRNRLRLPHAVDTSLRICVICPPDSKHAEAAKQAGASVVGEDTVFDAVKEGRIEFDRCICHQESVAKMNKAGLGRILGPRGLMPSAKFGTIVKDVGASVKGLVGGSEYRERNGVLRMAVGQLGFTPEELQANIKTFMGEIKKDIGVLSDRVNKEIHEVVSLGLIGCEEICADVCEGFEFYECSWVLTERGLSKPHITVVSRLIGALNIYLREPSTKHFYTAFRSRA